MGRVDAGGSAFARDVDSMEMGKALIVEFDSTGFAAHWRGSNQSRERPNFSVGLLYFLGVCPIPQLLAISD